MLSTCCRVYILFWFSSTSCTGFLCSHFPTTCQFPWLPTVTHRFQFLFIILPCEFKPSVLSSLSCMQSTAPYSNDGRQPPIKSEVVLCLLLFVVWVYVFVSWVLCCYKRLLLLDSHLLCDLQPPDRTKRKEWIILTSAFSSWTRRCVPSRTTQGIS